MVYDKQVLCGKIEQLIIVSCFVLYFPIHELYKFSYSHLPNNKIDVFCAL